MFAPIYLKVFLLRTLRIRKKGTPRAMLAACKVVADYQFLTRVSPITRPKSDCKML
jgi:hypothetical protein